MNKKLKDKQTSVTQMSLYKKALEICTLSFKLKTLCASKESFAQCESKEMISDHHLDALILTAIGLPQSIAQAAVTKDMYAQHGFSNYIRTATKQVKHHLRMLRRHRPIKESQCSALVNALKEFGNLQNQWSIVQLRKN